MKCISKLINKLCDKTGLGYVQTLIVILICIIVGAFFIVSTVAQLQAMEIKKTVRMEMNNLSSIITADTYNATKRGSLQEYEDRLSTSLTYRNYLLNTTKNNIATNLALTKSGTSFVGNDEKGNPDFVLSNFSLKQKNDKGRIEYTINCKITLYMQLFNNPIPGFDYDVSYVTHHIKNY